MTEKYVFFSREVNIYTLKEAIEFGVLDQGWKSHPSF